MDLGSVLAARMPLVIRHLPQIMHSRIAVLSGLAIWRTQAEDLAKLIWGEPDQADDEDHWKDQRFAPPQGRRRQA